MKILLSKKDDPRGQHVVFHCTREESYEAVSTIHSEVLQGKAEHVKETAEDGTIIFRFNKKYMDLLMLAFPMAELSQGITRQLRRAEEVRLEGMDVPTLKIPGFVGKLYDFQAISVAAVTDENYAQSIGYPTCIDYLNHEMGLGKTPISLSAAAILKERFEGNALAIVPNNAKFTSWADDIEKFFPKMSYEIYDSQTQSVGERAYVLNKRADITIVNMEAIRAKAIYENEEEQTGEIIGYKYANPELFDYEYGFAILDEHHRVKTPYAQVTNGFFQLVAEQWLCMSGTPILNRPQEIWTVLHKIYPDAFPDYNEFVAKLTITKKGKIVGYKTAAMKELRDFLALTSLRFRKDQVLKNLPQVITLPRLVTLGSEERRILTQIEEELVLEMEDGTVKSIGGALPQITRMKQACFSPELFGGSKHSSKVDELKIILEELIASGEKAIVFSQWEKACKILQRELAEFNPAYVTGKTKNQQRREEIRKFMEDEDCHIYVGTIGANREAINLGVATYVIFTDEGWVPAADDQAIGRSAAGGLRGAHLDKDTKITVVMLQAEDSYEENSVVLMKDSKRAVFNRTVERDGGKERPVKKVTLNDLKNMLSKNTRKKAKKIKSKKKVSAA